MASFTLNGRFLVQSITGVQRVAREVLMQLDQMADAGEVSPPRLLVPAKGDIVAAPDLQAITMERVGTRGGHAWEQLDLPAHCGAEPLLCLGNTAPVSRLLRSGQPTVTMVHDLSYKYFPSAYNWKFRALYHAVMPLILRRSAHVVTVSQAEETSIRTHYPFLKHSNQISFLQNGGLPDARAAQARKEVDLPEAQARGYGLYLGSLTRRKNAEGILNAAIAFLRRYPDMRFVVIGSTGGAFDGARLDVPPELADRLEFRGQINDAEKIYDACRNARFLLFPSFYEASPLPPIEAMSFGCPVVSSRIPSLQERCGDVAVYCDADDQDSIAAAIDHIMAEPEAWKALSDRSRAWTEQFTWRAQTEGLLRLIEAVS